MFGLLEMVEGVRTIVPVMATPIASTRSPSAAQLKVGGNLGIWKNAHLHLPQLTAAENPMTGK